MVKQRGKGQGARGKNKREVIIFKSIDEMADFLIGQWKAISEKAIKNRGQFTAALSGGKTPLGFFQKLSGEKNLPWDKTHIFMVDERFVPYKSAENNYHRINTALLRHVAAPARNIHPVLTSESSPLASAKRYERELISFFKITGGNLPEFDLVLLGIGGDGHTASLFPGTSSLKERKHLAVPVTLSNNKIRERITITLPVINNARHIMFLVGGPNKAGIVKEVILNRNSPAPASMVKPEKGKLFFLLDEGAAALLTKD
ncbi:MAG: 6-phosphogluconolactonase [Nitrospiraceae bacterium]|nr:MAG: 6-phosphogluconolactonase [Nitrospiraceae bacterium]